MIYLSIALIVISTQAYMAFRLYVESKRPSATTTPVVGAVVRAEVLETLLADVEKCKLALRIKTFGGNQ